jgi:hypothetical protein
MPSHIHKGLGFHPGIPCCKKMVTLNGALNRESDAPRVPPPSPPTVEAYTRNFTISAASSRPKTVAHCNYDASTRKSPTPPETPPRHHQQAPNSPRSHHQDSAGPTLPPKRSTTILPKRSLPARSSRPRPSHNRSRPATACQERPPPAAA